MSCKELVELVTDYLEGALEASEHERFEAHLAACEGCKHYVEQMRHTIQLTGKLTEDEITPPAREKLLTIFREWKRQAPPAQ